MSPLLSSRSECPESVRRDARIGHFCSRVSLETKAYRPKSVVAKERRVVGRQPKVNCFPI